jgi:hypothetical protein
MRSALALTAALSLVFSSSCSSNRAATRPIPVDAPPVASAPPPPPPVAAVVDAAPPDAKAAPAALAGEDFAEQAKALFRLAACGGDAPVPPRFDAKLVDSHCKDLKTKYAEYKRQWVDVAMPYLAKLVPPHLPTEVVYPFGGSDLMSALATFPDALTYTTISLEVSADVRRIDTITQKKLDAELALNRLHLGKLFEKVHSRTVNLDLESKSDLPGEIVFSMVAFAIYGFEPVSLRYFVFNADGTLKYLTAEDIKTMETVAEGKKRPAADVSAEIFGNVEIQFRKAGDASAPLKTFRHVAANLDDRHLRADPSLLRHLEAKGKVSAMTKAASHCLWSDDFTVIRQYLLDYMAWMISDSTGIPVRVASKAGWIQDTYGIMEGPEFFFVDTKDPASIKRDEDDMKRLWKQNAQHDLPFRYGYPDRNHHGHLMVTRRPDTPAGSP